MTERIIIRGEGSITEVERGHCYRIRFRLPPLEPGGSRRWSKSRTVHGNKAEARQELERYRVELEDGLNNEHHGLKVGTYAREFQERRRALGNLSPLTLDRDEIEIHRIEAIFGRESIQDLNVAVISNTYARLRRGGITASSLHKLHAKLSQIMKHAVREGIIKSNPCDFIEEIKRPKAKERRSLTDEQAFKLAEDLRSSERNGRIVAVWLALATGVRRGEALGLTWEDVDLDRQRIWVRKQLDSKMARRKTKSDASARNLSIDNGTVRFLEEWKAIQSNLFFDGGAVPDRTPVCTNNSGSFISPSAFDKWRRTFFVDHGLGTFENVEAKRDSRGVLRYKREGYVGYNLHELRHTQATFLIGSGADIKTVQARLGHSSASLTMDIYAHAIEQNDRKAAEAIGDLLGFAE